MRPLRLLAVAIAITALSAVGVATDQRIPLRPAAEQHAAVTSATAVCPAVADHGDSLETRLAVAFTGTGTAAPTVTLAPLGTSGHARTVSPGTTGYAETVTTGGGPVAVAATGAGAADVAAAQVSLDDNGALRGLAATECVRPAADWWFVGADGRVGYEDTLVLTNPAPDAATVSVSLLSSSPRPVTAPSLESITVPAHGVTSVEIPKVAPNVPNLALHVHATSGLVAAALRDGRIDGTTPRGSDWIPAAGAPAARVVVPGVVAGTGPRQLVVANPGTRAVTADIELLTDHGAFAPNGRSRLDIPGRTTGVLQLGPALQGQRAGVQVTADGPVLAAASSTITQRGELPDLDWTAGDEQLGVGATWPQVWDGSGRRNGLLLSAPGDAARVTVRNAAGKTATIPVPGRSTVAVDPDGLLPPARGGQGWLTVTAIGGGVVDAVQVVTENGAHGPLVAALPAVQPPTPVALPPVVYQQGIAVKP